MSCLHNVLAKMVLDSWWNGTSVSLGTLDRRAIGFEPSRASARSAEQQSVSSQDTVKVPAEEPPGETKQGTRKRRPLTKQTKDAVMGMQAASSPKKTKAAVMGMQAASSQAGPGGFVPSGCQCRGTCSFRKCRKSSVRNMRQSRMIRCVSMTLFQAKRFVLGVNARCVGEVAKVPMGMGVGVTLVANAKSRAPGNTIMNLGSGPLELSGMPRCGAPHGWLLSLVCTFPWTVSRGMPSLAISTTSEVGGRRRLRAKMHLHIAITMMATCSSCAWLLW